MIAPRKGSRLRIGRRKKPRGRLDEAAERTRREARAISRRQRAEARRALRAQGPGLDEVRVRLKGTALETRRRLRPVLRPFGALVAGVAPYITGSIFFVLKLVAAFVLQVLEIGRAIMRWLRSHLHPYGGSAVRALERHVTPLGTVAVIGAAAAVALGVSQFFDYHGVAVDAPEYAGRIGTIAPAPITDTKTAGSAHLWILLPVALAALCLVVATYRGYTKLAAAVVVCGLIGIAVAVAVDLPQGLDAGRAELAFSGSEARLLEGFWAEVAASATLILCGGLLALYSPGVSRARRRRGSSGPVARRGRASHREIGGTGLPADS